MAELKYKTKQREIITQVFKQNSDKCFTSKEIIELLQGQLGQATVYRLLAKLAEEGVICKYTAENGSGALYRINNCEKRESHKHFHLKCNSCGKLIHMDCTLLAKIAEHLQSDHGFFMDNSKTVLYGQCEECICKKELCCHE